MIAGNVLWFWESLINDAKAALSNKVITFPGIARGNDGSADHTRK